MKAAVQVLKQAEDIKSEVSGDILNDNETWTSHEKLKDLYQQLLVMDLEYALDKKVEQDLWNLVFKNQINALQSQAKDKKNPRRTESQGHLTWFLDVASGFYLQLLQELCGAFDLDLPCRRKGSVYGIVREAKPSSSESISPPQKSSCLYICQHCLVHLGDIARYRNQSLQAESFYRHAAQLVPSNGQPYNQLAILEAAKGEKLSTVYYYVRSIAVKYPFPVASTNLQKMFAKIAGDEICIEGKAKLSVYDYVNAFLQFHSLVHMISDLEKADKLLRVLSSNLTTLVATESLSSWKLVQMTAINLFTLSHLTHGFDCPPLEKKEKKFSLSDEENKAYLYMLELLASMLNGMLLLVYTMKEEENFLDYYALPIIKLILDWIRQDTDVLAAQPFLQKLQIWPSLCKLLNGVQQGIADDFDYNKFSDIPLPEDWDLQCFLPLSRSNKQYKFKENNVQLSDEEELFVRGVRLLKHGQWICEQEIAGKKLMKVQLTGGSGKLVFEAIIQKSPSSDILLQLEEVSGSKSMPGNQLDLLLDNCNDNIGILESEPQNGKFEMNLNHDVPEGIETSGNEVSGGVAARDKLGEVDKQRKMSDEKRTEKLEKAGLERRETRPTGYLREKKSRQNVAMQTIMQKKNTSLNEISEEALNLKPKSETKQVTFKTPSPSPPASSQGSPPLVVTSQPLAVSSTEGNFSPMQSVYPHLPQQTTYSSFTGVSPHETYGNQNLSNKSTISTAATYAPDRIAQPSLLTAGSYQQFKPPGQHHQNDYSPLATFTPSLKEAVTLSQGVGNRMNPMSGNVTQTVHQQPFLYNLSPGPNAAINPNLAKPSFLFGENPMFGQPVQWYSSPAIPNPASGIQHLAGLKPNNLESLMSQNQARSSRQMEVSPQAVSSHPPAHSQPLAHGTYQIFTSSQPTAHPSPQQQQTANTMAESVLFQMQTPSPLIRYNFQPSVPNRLQPNATSLHLASAPQAKLGMEQPATLASAKLDVETLSAANEVMTNTYSLFNSPWSSGLNVCPSTGKDGICLQPASSVPPAAAAPTNFGNFLQPGVQQSFWSGPGPSPLERLLEQQKQKRDAAPL